MNKNFKMENSVRKLIYFTPKSFDGKYLKDFLIAQGYSNELLKHIKKTMGIDLFHILSYLHGSRSLLRQNEHRL